MNNLNHLGEFKIIGNDKKYDFLIFDKYTSVDFILDNDVTIKLDGALIQSVSYTSNSNMVIHLLSFSPLLSIVFIAAFISQPSMYSIGDITFSSFDNQTSLPVNNMICRPT